MEEGEETAEDTLMIAVHVDEDAIDQESAELLDAECPNKGINTFDIHVPSKAFKFSGHLCDHVKMITVKGHFYVHDRFIQICQTGLLINFYMICILAFYAL